MVWVLEVRCEPEASVAVGFHCADVEGLYADWPHSTKVVERLTADALDWLLPGLASGMLPKMEGCLRAVRGGVRRAHVLDGRVPHAVLRGTLGDSAPGTTAVPGPARRG